MTVYNNQNWALLGGMMRLVSLETDGTFSALIPSYPPRSRRIEFIGDSMTAATNLRRPPGDPDYGIPQASASPTDNNDYTLSYQAQMCIALDANCSTIATGGHGMLSNCCGNTCPGPWCATVPQQYQSTFGHDSSSVPQHTYDFDSAPVPDAIVINLGTNDFYGCKDYSPTDDGCGPKFWKMFTQTYVDFMMNATKSHRSNEIKFFAAAGPMLGQSNGGLPMWNAIRDAVTQGVALGLNVTFIDMEACEPGGGGCQGTANHPGIAGHHRMFELGYPIIKETMGW